MCENKEVKETRHRRKKSERKRVKGETENHANAPLKAANFFCSEWRHEVVRHSVCSPE